MTARGTHRPGRERVAADGDLVDRRLAADPARRGRDEMALGHGAVVERLRQPDDDRVVGLAERDRIAGARGDRLVAADQALRAEEADGQLGLVARRPHRDRHRDRILVRPGGPDLERRLADHAVVADLERLATDGHDPATRDVPDRGLADVAHGRMIGGR